MTYARGGFSKHHPEKTRGGAAKGHLSFAGRNNPWAGSEMVNMGTQGISLNLV